MLKRSPTPRDLIDDLVRTNPGAKKEDLFERFRSSLDEGGRRVTEWFYFINIYDAIRLPAPRQGKAVEPRGVVDHLKSKIRTVVLMELLLPNGIKLKEATFADCSMAGGWFVALANLGDPSDIVGDKLTESDLWEAWQAKVET